MARSRNTAAAANTPPAAPEPSAAAEAPPAEKPGLPDLEALRNFLARRERRTRAWCTQQVRLMNPSELAQLRKDLADELAANPEPPKA